jgi:hypothetical protein
LSVSPRLAIFLTDNTYMYLLGTCPSKKKRLVCIAMSWKAVIVPVRFFPLGYTIYNCVKHALENTYKATLFKWGRITQTFEIVKLFSKIQCKFDIDKYNIIIVLLFPIAAICIKFIYKIFIASSLHVDLQITAIGKRRTMTIFAKIYCFK